MESNRNWYVSSISDLLFAHMDSYVLSISSVTILLFQERIRTYMNRVKEITEKKKAARLDKGAAARFVRSALYDPDDKDSKKKAAGTSSETPPSKRSKQKWNKEESAEYVKVQRSQPKVVWSTITQDS